MKKILWFGIFTLAIVAVYVTLWHPDMLVDPTFKYAAIERPVAAKPTVIAPIVSQAAPVNATVPAATPQTSTDTPTETPAAPAPTATPAETPPTSPTGTCVGNTGNSNCEFNPAITQCLDNNTCGKDD